MNKKIDFIIGGAQKSSTSYLASILTSSTKIFIPDGEIAYFQDPDFKTQTEDDFNKHFQEAPETCLLGIKRPGYLSSDESPIYINEYRKDIKLIFVLRDPVERSISSLFHNMKYGFLPIERTEQLFKKIIKNELPEYPRNQEVIEYSYYGKYLDKWFTIFEPGQIFLVTQEELISSTEQVIQDISKFLGINDSIKYKEPVLKKQETIYSYLRLKWVIKRNKYKFKYNEDRTRLYIKKQNFFNNLQYNFISAVDKFILKTLLGNNKDIAFETRKSLIHLFKEDVEKIKQRLPSVSRYWKNFSN